MPDTPARRRRPGGTVAARRRSVSSTVAGGRPTAQPRPPRPANPRRAGAPGPAATPATAAAAGTTRPVPGRPLRLAAVLTALDGVALGAYGLWLLVAVLTRPRGTALGVVVLLGLLFAAFGTGLVLAGRSLWRASRRGRAPTVVAHLIILLLVPELLAGGTWWLGIPLAVISITAGVCLFLPSSVRALAPRGGPTPAR